MTPNQQQTPFSGIMPFITNIMNKNPFTSSILKFIHNNPLYKGIIILGSGTAFAQMIGIITMPIITRLYTPSDLGVLAVYSSILAIVGIGATLRYEFAYALPEDDKDAANIFGLCLILLLITTTILASILIFGSELLMSIFDLNAVRQYLWFLLIGFLGMGLYNILNYWALRQRDYKQITYTKINQGAGGAITKIVLGILAFGPIGLIIGHIVSQIAGIGTFGRKMWRVEKENLRTISLNGMKRVASTYKGFSLYGFPASIINTISLQIPPIILLAIYDASIVGYYALAQMIVVLPSSFISRSMGQAYRGEISKMVREKSCELLSIYKTTLKHLSLISILLVGIPAVCAPLVVPYFFGEVWIEAGWYCLPLALAVIGDFIIGSTTNLGIYGYNHWMLLWDSSRLISVLFGFYICYIFNIPILYTLLIYSIILSIMYIINIILDYVAIKRFISTFIK